MKTRITHDQFIEMSTDLAEKEHHEHCEYACCGEHNDFLDYTKCPECGMTPEIQEAHNNDWWAGVDEIEGNLLEEYDLIQ